MLMGDGDDALDGMGIGGVEPIETRYRWRPSDTMVRVLGWFGATLHGDPLLFGRWLWLRARLQGGDATTFDAGAGSGAFAMYAASRGNTVVGASFAVADLARAQRRSALLNLGVTYALLDLRELDRHVPRLGTFDQILCLEVVEHILDDAYVVQHLSRLLKPGGRLFLTTPDERHKKLVGDVPPTTVENGGHVRFGYDLEDLRRLAAAGGLTIESVEGIGGIIGQQLTNVTRALAKIHPLLGWAAVVPFKPLLVVDNAVTHLLRYPFQTVAMIAVKPVEAAGPTVDA
jgi:SAM-dependent methyltransferase